MINIPYGALTALLTRDQDERMIINIFRMFMAQVGALLINLFTLPLVNAFGGSKYQKSWIIVSILYGAIAVALFYICFAKTKERVNVSSQKTEKIAFGKSIKIIMKNDYWLILVAIWVIMILGMSMGMGVGTYYAKYILLNENLVGLLTGASLVPVLFLMPVIAILNRKFGKCKVALVGSAFSLIAQLLMLLGAESFPWLLFCALLKGVGSSALTGTMFAMIADTIEYGHWKTGVRTEGMLYSSTTFGAKVGAGIGGAAALAILGVVGYNGALATQTPQVIEAIKILYLIVPIPFTAALPLLYSRYKLDKIYPQVMEDLEKREEEAKKEQ